MKPSGDHHTSSSPAAARLIEAAKRHPLYENVLRTSGHIVIGRGDMESPDYLFVGEAPGQSENIAGKPFVGRSGKILDEWIGKAGITRYAVINAVPMMPHNKDGSIRTPTQDEIRYFRPFTKALIGEISPKRIICVGKSAAKFLEVDKDFRNKQWSGNIGFIYHPSYYLRNGVKGTEDFLELIRNSPDSGETQAAIPENPEPAGKKQKGLGEFI